MSKFDLSEEEAKAYPNLETAIREDLNNYLDMTAEEDRQRLNESFDPSMLQDEYFNGLSIEGSAGILRADENFFSVVISKNVWLGGQHPSTARICFNYSTQDGSLIVPSDIFTSKADLIAALKEKLKAIPDVEYFNLDEDLEMYDFEHGPMADNIAFSMGITDDGIVFTKKVDDAHITIEAESTGSSDSHYYDRQVKVLIEFK